MATVARRSDGWEARWRAPDGKSRRKQFARKIDAERWLTKVQHELFLGAYVDPSDGKVTVAEWWETWSQRQQWRDSSRASVTSLFRRQVLPALGARPLNSLRRGDIEAFIAGLPVAKQYGRQITQYLSTMLEAAVVDGLLSANPARGAKRPRVDREPIVPFTSDEVGALIEASPDWFAAAITLGLGAGLRHSEAAGLTVGRVDFLHRQLVVDRQLVKVRDRVPSFGPPKSKRSYRTVPLADPVVETLARHVERFGPGDHDLLLHRLDGSPVARDHFGRVWRSLRDRADLPRARFHDTRHTFASVLLSGGVSVPAAADYLGHTPGELLRTYAHLLPADHDRVRSVVQSALTRDLLCPTRFQAGVD